MTEVTSKVLAEAVLIEAVAERLRGYLARSRVYTGVTEVKCIYKPSVSLCEVLCGINTAFV